MRAITFKARRFGSAAEAYQWAEAAGGEAVTVDALPGAYAAPRRECDRLQAAGVGMATWHLHEGRLVSVPVN